MLNDPNKRFKSLPFKLTLMAIIALIALSVLTLLSNSVAILIPAIAIAHHLKHLLPPALVTSYKEFLSYLAIFLVAAQVALVFFLWNFRLFSGSPHIPIRSMLLYILTLAGTIYWHVKFFTTGFPHHTPLLFPGAALSLNTAVFIVSTGVLISGMTKPRFAANLGFNFLLFVWLFYCAFPWYFETL